MKAWTERSLMRLVNCLRMKGFDARIVTMLSTLIILLVAYKDNLENELTSINCFNWLCVLRYYLL